MNKVFRLIELYDKGILTKSTLLYQIIYDSDRNLDGISAEWVAEIKREVDRLPKTEEQWADSIVLFDWCGHGPGPTQEELREDHMPKVKLWREYFRLWENNFP